MKKKIYNHILNKQIVFFDKKIKKYTIKILKYDTYNKNN